MVALQQRMEISGIRNLDSGFKFIHADSVVIVKIVVIRF